jgi:hypothetical protein
MTDALDKARQPGKIGDGVTTCLFCAAPLGEDSIYDKGNGEGACRKCGEAEIMAQKIDGLATKCLAASINTGNGFPPELSTEDYLKLYAAVSELDAAKQRISELEGLAFAEKPEGEDIADGLFRLSNHKPSGYERQFLNAAATYILKLRMVRSEAHQAGFLACQKAAVECARSIELDTFNKVGNPMIREFVPRIAQAISELKPEGQ